jgi:hypothetical protein
MLSNPYPDPPPGSSDHKITARVSLDDYYFLKNLLPAQFGLTDKIVATLYKRFIDELRTLDAAGAFNTHDDDPEPIRKFRAGFYPGSPTYALVERVLSEFQRQPAAESIGQAGPRDVADGTGGIREEVRGATEQRTEPQGGTKTRSGKPRSGKKGQSKETK